MPPLLVRFLTGREYTYNASFDAGATYRRAPAGFDSVAPHSNGSAIWCVYERCRTYVSHVIVYRLGGDVA